MKKNLVIIVAGGVGKRINSDIPKQLIKIGAKHLIEYTIESFENNSKIDLIYIVSHKKNIENIRTIVNNRSFSKVKKILNGGRTRQLSSRIGVYASDESVKNILIHDAARPFISSGLIDSILSNLDKFSAVNLAVSSTDTLIETSGKMMKKQIDRDIIKKVQTPQGFRRQIILDSHKLAEKDGIEGFTDDCSMVHSYKLSDIYVQKGEESNFKITFKEDIELAEKIISGK
ncbi:MAG: IspD/TarI family cytidylyltransferase [Acidobacteriota bacterium]